MELVPSTDSRDMTFEEFKRCVKTYLDVSEDVAKLSDTLRARKRMQAALSDRISAFMEANDIGDLRTRNVRIVLKHRKAKVPLKKKDMRRRLEDHLGSKEAADKLFAAVYESGRQVVESTRLLSAAV